MAEKLHYSLEALESLHRFGDIYAGAIHSIKSDKVDFEVIREARDSIGRHWYGMRCRITSKQTGQTNYLHTGLIFLPETRIGLMVEVDEQNNHHNYGLLVNGLIDTELFVVNRDEKEYLKLFMPDQTFEAMSGRSAGEQMDMLAAYMKACGESIMEVSDRKGFTLTTQDLLNTVYLGRAFKEVIETAKSDVYSVEINEADPDNFGQYASGYRYWLSNKDKSVRMYAYFGAIYSYKKRPAGIFAEIDWFSNQSCFDQVKAHFAGRDEFLYSNKEEKFIKLFMTPEGEEAFNAASPEEQLVQLKNFFNACCEALAVASGK